MSDAWLRTYEVVHVKHVIIMHVEQGVFACIYVYTVKCRRMGVEINHISGKSQFPAKHFDKEINLKKSDDVAWHASLMNFKVSII